jgi:hypothetical protein
LQARFTLTRGTPKGEVEIEQGSGWTRAQGGVGLVWEGSKRSFGIASVEMERGMP